MTESTTTKPAGLLTWCARALGALAATVLLSAAPPAAAFHFPWDQGHDTTSSNDPPPPGPCEGPTCDDDCGKNASRSPVYAALGHAIWRDTDVVLRGRPYIGVYRVYNSNDPVVGLFGNGWAVCFDVALYPASKSGVQERIYKASNGKRFVYTKQADGSFLAPAGRFETVVEGPSSVTMTLLDGRRHVFALDGRLVERVDTNGSRVSFSYDSSARPVRMADANGRFLQLSYNATSLVDTVSDHTGRTWRYGYDANGNLTSVTDPAGGVQRYAWQAYRPAGDANTYWQLLSSTDASGVVAVSFAYTGNQVASYTEGANRITYTRPGSNTATGGTVTQRDAMNVAKSFTYGSLGLVTRDVDGMGFVTTFAYDANGRITATVDGLGRTWSTAYDALGRPTSSTNPLNQTTSYQYSGNDPRPVRIVSPSGRVMAMSYDASGNVLSTTDPSGAVTSMSYNAAGDVTSVTDALGRITRMAYSATGLPTQVTDALGRVTTMAYDALGRQTGTTNAAGETTAFAYDALDRLSSVTDPLGQVTSYTYDAAGRRLSITDAKGSVTRYEYDSFGRRTAEVAPDGRRTSFAYRADNQVATITAPDATVTSYQYDANKRVTSEVAGGETISYGYNAVNQLVTSTGPGGTVGYTYDAAGRVATETSNGRVLTTTRNADGERTRLDFLGLSQVYTRDARGQVSRIAAAAGNFDFAYDAAGRRTQQTLPNGAATSYSYDAAGQLAALAHSGPFSASYAHSFDAAGRITRISGDGPDWVYAYDALGRLTSATQGASTTSYVLDAVGNIGGDGRTFDLNHRLTSDAARDYSYDARGNLTLERDRATGARTAYTWNARNQLVRVETFADGVSTTPTRRLNYTYDPSGRRASKVDNGILNTYVYDGDDLVATLDSTASVVSTTLYSGQLDDPLAQTGGGSTKYLSANQRGNVMAVSDGLTLAQSYGYGPYGETLAGSSADGVPFRFTSREKDADSLYYFRSRYYDTRLKRFLSPDTIGLNGGMNPYAYGDGDPIGNADPYGQCPMCAAAIIGGLIGGGIDLGLQLIQNGGNFGCVNWGSVGISALAGAAGGALGGAGSLTRAAGTEWSHWIPARYFRPTSASYKPWLPSWLDGPLNGNYVSPMRHYMHDPFRYPAGWRNWGDRLSKPLQQLDRIPDWLKGATAGGAAGAAATPGSDCGCK